MDNILYYPYINVPPSDWTVRTLLYYETMGTIVPHSYLSNTRNYDPFMRDLVKGGLVRPISPAEALRNPEEVTRQFILYLESKDFDLKKRIRNFRDKRRGRIHPGKFSNSLSTIHSEKFDYELFYKLKHAGIAKRSNQWYEVESKTANELMTFIATVIGTKLNYLPTTDQLKRKPLKAIGLKKKDFQSFKTENEKRYVILQNLIPFPGQYDLKKLRKFKEENFSLLVKFKRKVEDLILNPALEPGSESFENKIEILKDQKEEISARMNESRLVPKLINAAGIVASIGGLQSETEFGIIAGTIGLSGAILQALSIEKPKNTVDQTGLKYLALADRTLRRPAPYSFY